METNLSAVAFDFYAKLTIKKFIGTSRLEYYRKLQNCLYNETLHCIPHVTFFIDRWTD